MSEENKDQQPTESFITKEQLKAVLGQFSDQLITQVKAITEGQTSAPKEPTEKDSKEGDDQLSALMREVKALRDEKTRFEKTSAITKALKGHGLDDAAVEYLLSTQYDNFGDVAGDLRVGEKPVKEFIAEWVTSPVGSRFAPQPKQEKGTDDTGVVKTADGKVDSQATLFNAFSQLNLG